MSTSDSSQKSNFQARRWKPSTLLGGLLQLAEPLGFSQGFAAEDGKTFQLVLAHAPSGDGYGAIGTLELHEFTTASQPD